MRKNRNRILLGIITLLLCFFSINDNVYADFSNNEVHCIYEDRLGIQINVDRNLALLKIRDKTTSCGATEDDPCYVIKVSNTNGSNLLNGDFITAGSQVAGIAGIIAGGNSNSWRLDLKEWPPFIQNGFISCPTIYYSRECKKLIKGGYTCTYNFGPKYDESKGITNESNSSIHTGSSKPTQSGNNSTMCSSTIVNKFREDVIGKEISSIEKKVKEEFLPNIDKYTNASANEYTDLIHTYDLKFEDLFNSSMDNIKKAQKMGSYQCDFGNDYNSMISYFQQSTQSLRLLMANTINSKIEEAEKKAIDEGKDVNIYEAVKDINETKKNESIDSIKDNISDVREEYKSILDHLNNGKDDTTGNQTGECKAILEPEMLDLINEVIKWIRISVPILLIVFGSIDFGKAVIADDKDIMKKASSSFIKRCIIAFAIFFLPTLINILIAIFNSVSDKPLADLINCGIK